MNDRYGVDPCAASTALELAFLRRQFGPEHGRFIVNFPSDWHAHVGMQYPGAGDIERARLTEFLPGAKLHHSRVLQALGISSLAHTADKGHPGFRECLADPLG